MRNYLMTLSFCLLTCVLFSQDEPSAITINERGNVGISNDNPSEQLDVTGNINADGKVKENGHDLMPSGAIIMFHGSTIPHGWIICDGKDGKTPDLRGRFVVGVDNRLDNKEDTVYPLNSTGGFEKIELSIDELPKHQMDIDLSSNNVYYWHRSFEGGKGKQRTLYFAYDGYIPGKTDKGAVELKSKVIGKNRPHENRPPYYALYYIMKL